MLAFFFTWLFTLFE
ncbi:hypothetical protein D039_2216A, partial [Vibrio parahaemolyticus EKP-028]